MVGSADIVCKETGYDYHVDNEVGMKYDCNEVYMYGQVSAWQSATQLPISCH